MFPVTLMQNLKSLQKKKTERRNQTSAVEGEERQKSREEGEKERKKKKHAKSICIRAPVFVSLVVRQITFIEPDGELKSRPGGAFEAAKRLLRLFAL